MLGRGGGGAVVFNLAAIALARETAAIALARATASACLYSLVVVAVVTDDDDELATFLT